MRRLARYRSIEIVDGPSWWPSVGFAAAAVLAQASLAPLLAFRDAFPSLATAVVVLYALRAGARRGAMLGIVTGVLEDIFAGTGGAWTIGTTLAALGAGGVVKRLAGDGAVLPAILVGLFVIARDAVFWSVMRLEGYPPGYATVHAHAALWRGALTALCVAAFLLVRARFVTDRTRVERY